MLRTVVATAVIAATIAALTSRPSAAFGPFCSEPRKPFCVDYGNSFKDEDSFRSCRNDVESYTRAVDHYVDCLNDARSAAIKESNRVVDRFNCKARGGTICL